ncbi:RNA polymerase-associated protein rtf1 [Mycoemilia scoparia]|uniref:RNA polymerase-associated protein rtf1 n=1 Tax=Mycoemilia scoparia TaxID=417184 RepID=A0A9W8DNM5_9FUNG|nr:RNA polymerase-associated protein rtf1 [Mycoemilia scoparia]
MQRQQQQQEDDLEGAILALFDGDEAPQGSGSRKLGSDVDIESDGRRRHGSGGSKSRKHKHRSDNEDLSDDYSSKRRKKQGDTGKHREDEEEDMSSDAIDDWDSDLMGDDKDRDYLMSLPEFEREKILADRQEQRDILMERRELKRRLRRESEGGWAKKKKHRNLSSDSEEEYSDRASARKRKSSKGDKLGEIRRRRNEREHGKRSRAYDDDYSDEEGYLSRDEEDEDSNVVYASLLDLSSIRMKRNQLVDWVFFPFFKKTVIGCFIRVNMGEDSSDSYKIVEIKDVIENTSPYTVNNVVTDKRLRLRVGKQTRDIVINIVSNSPFTEQEFDEFQKTLQQNKVKRPTLDHVKNKIKSLQAAASYALTDAEITKMVEERKRLRQVPENIAMKRADLHQRQRIEQELNELDSKPKGFATPAKHFQQRPQQGTPAARFRGPGGTPLSGDGSAKPGFGPLSGPQNFPGQLVFAKSLSRGKSVDSMVEDTPKPPVIIQTKVKTTPGYTELMAAPGFDLSFVKI